MPRSAFRARRAEDGRHGVARRSLGLAAEFVAFGFGQTAPDAERFVGMSGRGRKLKIR